jgi:hypothetical protein
LCNHPAPEDSESCAERVAQDAANDDADNLLAGGEDKGGNLRSGKKSKEIRLILNTFLQITFHLNFSAN